MKTLKQYLESKDITEDKFNEMDAENKAAIFNELNELNATAFKTLEANVEGTVTKEDLDKAITADKNIRAKQLETLNDVLKEYGVSIKKLSEGQTPQNVNKEGAFQDSLKKGLAENIDKLKDATQGWMTFKTVGNITSANISGGNVPVEQRLPGFDTLANRKIRLFDLISRGTTTSNLVSWVSQSGREGAAGTTGEGLAKNQIDFNLVVDNEAAKKLTAFIKVSTEMLNDVDFLQSEINNELMVELMKVMEEQVYEGDGTGLNLNGIRTVASAFSASAPFTLGVDNANQADVLVAAMNQIEIAEQDEATAVLMHPSDVNFLKAIKVSTTDKRYVERLLNIGSSVSIDGVPVVKSTLVTQGEYLVGHFPHALMLDHEALEVQMGLDADDFTKNFRTFIAEWRGLVLVKTNKRASFVAGVFATDQAAIETA